MILCRPAYLKRAIAPLLFGVHVKGALTLLEVTLVRGTTFWKAIQ